MDYPQGQSLEQEKDLLATQVIEAREHKIALADLARPTDVTPNELCFISEIKTKEETKQVRITSNYCKSLCEQALESNQNIRLEYPQKKSDPKWMTVTPEKITAAGNGASSLLDAFMSRIEN